jgi:hypothetical protein
MNKFLPILAIILLCCVSPFALSAQCVFVQNCPSGSIELCDNTNNDPLFWNANTFWDPITESYDLGEGENIPELKAVLGCGTDYTVSWSLFLDIDQNGTLESVLTDTHTIVHGYFPIGNASNPGFSIDTITRYDIRPVPPGQKYGFALEDTLLGDTLIARLRWQSALSPAAYFDAKLPYGTHRIQWIITQGTERDTCTIPFTIKDCKKPTVVCINTLSVNIMPTRMIMLWDTDFLQYKEDNHSRSNQIITAISRAGVGSGFPYDTLGNPITHLVFDCKDLGVQALNLWVQDLAGNVDSCQTFIIIQDANGFCGGPNLPRELVCFTTEQGKGIENVDVKIDPAFTGMPSFFSILDDTDDDGCYELAPSVPFFIADKCIIPKKDDNPLNGVSTYDLVLIARHVLGQLKLDSPYKMIAADGNKSGSITTFDVVEIRKLILGIYDDFPNNTSWRFVDKAFDFPNDDNPFQTNFPEQICNLNLDSFPYNMVAIKVGDVNNSAIASSIQGDEATDARETVALVLPEVLMEAGDVLEVPLNLEEVGAWDGAQWVLRYDADALEVLGVQSSLEASSWAWHAPQPGELRFVWAGGVPEMLFPDEALATLTLRAKTPLRLSETLRLDEAGLRAELYGAVGRQGLDLVFRSQPTSAGQHAVLTPQPNPVQQRLRFPLRLEQTAEVDLRLWDVEGREMMHQNSVLPPGEQWMEVETSSWQPGLYSWQVQVDGKWYTGKIIKQ